MIAILTDKPNVGREIARVVGAHKKENGYMTGGGYMVTWTFGNMLSLAMPKDSGKARVEWEDFPLVPPPYLTVKNMKTDTGWNPDINAVLQLKVIAKVFDACDTIIAATDASREGEMLFRHLYRFLGCKQPCLRLWISSLTDEAILEGMANLRPCHQFDNLFLAAISGRYRERENHIGADSWPVFISICKDNRIIKMRRTEDFEEHRNATELYEDCKAARKARITAVSRRTEEVRAPALYDLTGLQTDANLYHGLTAIQVQEITQSLYEKKLISYPRTACRFLPEDVYATLPAVMEKMLARKEFQTYADRLDIAGAKAVINPQKTTEHHAIIITGMSPGDLAREEMQVYTLIVGRMLEAFSPSCKVEYTTVDAVCAAHKFRTRTYRILEKGWTGVLGREHLIAEEGFSSLSLPELSRDELVEVAGCSIIRKRNLPPSPYTDAELVGFMDRNGLGTVATRANIIRTLLERKYIRYSGKYVIPTPKGLFFYETVRGMKIADASLTSGWEAELAQIERGERTPEEFLDGVLELVRGITGEIRRIQRPEE